MKVFSLLILTSIILTFVSNEEIPNAKNFLQREKKAKALACTILTNTLATKVTDRRRIGELLKKNKIITRNNEIKEKSMNFLTTICYLRIKEEETNDIITGVSEKKFDILNKEEYLKLFDIESGLDFKKIKKNMNRVKEIMRIIEEEEEDKKREEKEEERDVEKVVQDLRKKLKNNNLYNTNYDPNSKEPEEDKNEDKIDEDYRPNFDNLDDDEDYDDRMIDEQIRLREKRLKDARENRFKKYKVYIKQLKEKYEDTMDNIEMFFDDYGLEWNVVKALFFSLLVLIIILICRCRNKSKKETKDEKKIIENDIKDKNKGDKDNKNDKKTENINKEKKKKDNDKKMKKE